MASTKQFRDLLATRSSQAALDLTDRQLDDLTGYYQLLAKWNRRINLTAYDLNQISESAIDRLFIEPLAAARIFPTETLELFDLGSGGGSPAIPLKIVLPNASITMVESRARKAAFLREAVRDIGLDHARVESSRFEAAAKKFAATADYVTARAVRPDSALFAAAESLLRLGGDLLFFGREPIRVRSESLQFIESLQLGSNRLASSSPLVLTRLRRTFHVEQSR